MECSTLRCLLGGATAVALVGCRPGPLTADDATTPPRPVDLSAPAPAPAADRRPVDQPLPPLGPDATLEDYVRYAALANAGLEAMFHEWKAAVERVPQVRALPDPRLTYGYYLGEVETRVGPMRHSISLAQTFPWFGKLADREDAAARHADAAWQRLESARLALRFRVERAYNELYYLGRSIEITEANVELLQQFERVARDRYRVAAVNHPDVIRIQVELGTLEDRLRQLRDLRAPAVARLNAELNRPDDAELPWPAGVDERVSDRPPEALIGTLRTRNPELLALQEEIERERIGSAIARKDGLPDFTVGLAYTVVGDRVDVDIPEEGDDAVLATLSVNLPIWREKYDAGVREALARRLAAAGRRRDATHRLTAELREALFEHEDARRRIALYRDTLIPKADESLQASLAGFQQGTTDFLDLIDTERTLLEFQLALERARADRATSYARIERLVGVRLETMP